MNHLKTNKAEHIVLRSVDSFSNRFREYRLSVTKVHIPQCLFVVKCTWGRLGQPKQSKQFVFMKEEKLNSFIQSILMKRKRHGYGIVEKSERFPSCDAEQSMPLIEDTRKQGQLFPL